MKKIVSIILAVVMCLCMFAGCSAKREQVIIYTCANDKRIALMTEFMQEKFPQYDIIVEYQSTSKLSAKLLAEGTNTDCDIVHDLSYLNLGALSDAGILADVSGMDISGFVDGVNVSDNYVIECRTGGAVVLNLDVLADRGLEKPTCYEDLLKPEYKGLISMPDPKSSSTGYMFIKSLVNAWGEEKAFDYFEKLAENVLQFTSSGSGPVNALVQEEVAIGLGMIDNAAMQMSDSINLEICIFEEGAPFAMYGQSIIKGKDERECVKEVFDVLFYEYMDLDAETFGAETIWTDKEYTTEFHPQNIAYGDMSNDTLEEKERLLAMWNIT